MEKDSAQIYWFSKAMLQILFKGHYSHYMYSVACLCYYITNSQSKLMWTEFGKIASADTLAEVTYLYAWFWQSCLVPTMAT